MALDDTTQKLYRAADANTLLALLPLLRRLIERTVDEMKHFERAEREIADADAEIAETYGEILVMFDGAIR